MSELKLLAPGVKVSAKGRVVGADRYRFTVFIPSLRPRRRPAQQQENTGNAPAETPAGQEGSQDQAHPAQERGRREREEPEGIYANFAGVPLDIRIGDTVEVEGHIEAYSAVNRIWGGRYTYIQNLVADKVSLSKTRIEEVFGVRAGFYMGRPYFDAAVRGTVTRVNDVPGWRIITIRTPGTGPRSRDNEIRVQYPLPAKDSNRRPPRVSNIAVGEGDEIGVIVDLITRRSIDKGTGARRTFENLLIEDMHVFRKVAPIDGVTEDAEDLFSALTEEEEDVVSSAEATDPADTPVSAESKETEDEDEEDFFSDTDKEGAAASSADASAAE